MPSITVDGREIDLSRTDKPLFPDGTTKGDLIEYYRKIADAMIPYMADRPLVMHRFPDGVGGEDFYQKDMPDYFPRWIHHVTVEKEGGTVTHVVCDNAATLVYLADQACITPHLWLSRRDRLHHPDRMILDLDPANGDFDDVRAGALLLRDALEEVGLTPFVMTTGSRGLHVVVPLNASDDFDRVRHFAGRLASHIAREDPKHFTTEQRKAKRRNRVFIDLARNAYAQTAVAPYSVRARERPYVATPLDWKEVNNAGLTATGYTIRNIFRRLGQREDPWRDMNRYASSMEAAREKLNRLISDR